VAVGVEMIENFYNHFSYQRSILETYYSFILDAEFKLVHNLKFFLILIVVLDTII